jgi:hypothetical protein
MKTYVSIAAALLAAGLAAAAESKDQAMDSAKLEAFVDANIKATHAYQTLAAKKFGAEIYNKYWNTGGLSDAELNNLVALQKAMLAEPVENIIAWAKGDGAKFDEKKYIEAIRESKLTADYSKLPVNVWIEYLKEKAPKATPVQVKAVANLQQMITEIDRDGDTLQDLFRVYSALGLPVYFGQLGLTAANDDEFMAIANELAPKIAAIPYDKSPGTIRMACHKMYNWGRRYSGERDNAAMAKELLADPDLKEAIAAAAKLPPQKIAVIGHSFSMAVHWSTPGSFVPIVAEMMKTVNPQVEFKFFQEGGMRAQRAYEKFYKNALAYHPDAVLFVILTGGEHRQALKTMVEGFTQAGTKCLIFDSLWPADWDQYSKATDPILSKVKLNIIEVKPVLMASPNKGKFVCLDGVHMTEYWHVVMAKEWFKYLAGVRKEKLEAKAPAGAPRE